MTKKRSKSSVFILLVLLAACGVGFYFYLHRNEESTDDAAIDARVVMISPKVAGYIKVLYVSDNQQVKAGDVLLEIDPADYIIRRDHAAAALQAAEEAATASDNSRQATDVSAPSNLELARSQVASAEALWNKAASDLKRMHRLSSEARSQEQLDQAVADEKTTRSALDEARARLRSAETAPKTMAVAEANSHQQTAQVVEAKADLAQAEKDLADTKIVAPMDGTITKRAAERGDYVIPGQLLGSLVGVERWVTANFKEIQLEHMRPGQRVTVKVDAFPEVNLLGEVDSVQSGTGARFSAFPPENATGNFVKVVQRVPVKITFKGHLPASLVLGPGMSVVPTVFTVEDVAAKEPAP